MTSTADNELQLVNHDSPDCLSLDFGWLRGMESIVTLICCQSDHREVEEKNAPH